MDENDGDIDFAIIGAGLSGIGLAHYLRTEFPGKRAVILEARASSGGTWDLFRYPGVRSDSDMYTLGYAFRPWTNPKAIADGRDILDYIRATARDGGLEPSIRYGHRVVAARWSSEERMWELDVEVDSVTRIVGANFIVSCTGYYSYSQPHWPRFEQQEDFSGPIVHPQFWPADLEVADKDVVVIGSGATAITLAPALASAGARVTMLQRSPTYVVTLPERDWLADLLRPLLPAKWVYGFVRWKHILASLYAYQASKAWPKAVKKAIVERVAAQLPDGYDVGKHFTPRYDPWDERICAVPDGDLFQRVADGSVAVVTDTIERFGTDGIRLSSGTTLACDAVVVATGLNLEFMGGIELRVDGRVVEARDLLTYRGMMYGGVPNLITVFGYTNSSWTLKIDIIGPYLLRLLRHMDRHGFASVTPHLDDPSVAPDTFSRLQSGYIKRAVDKFPAQGNKAPWRMKDNYVLDRFDFATASVDVPALRFERREGALAGPVSAAAPGAVSGAEPEWARTPPTT